MININSAEGEHEFTMDEVEVIQSYLLSQAGDDTDVILGLGYDNSLGNEIGITLIATSLNTRSICKGNKNRWLLIIKIRKLYLNLKCQKKLKLCSSFRSSGCRRNSCSSGVQG